MAYGTNVATFDAPLFDCVRCAITRNWTGVGIADLWPPFMAMPAIKPLCVYMCAGETERVKQRKRETEGDVETIANWQTKFHNNVRRPNWSTTMATDGISSGQVSLAVHNSVPSDIFDGLLTLESRWVQRQALRTLNKVSKLTQTATWTMSLKFGNVANEWKLATKSN